MKRNINHLRPGNQFEHEGRWYEVGATVWRNGHKLGTNARQLNRQGGKPIAAYELFYDVEEEEHVETKV